MATQEFLFGEIESLKPGKLCFLDCLNVVKELSESCFLCLKSGPEKEVVSFIIENGGLRHRSFSTRLRHALASVGFAVVDVMVIRGVERAMATRDLLRELPVAHPAADCSGGPLVTEMQQVGIFDPRTPPQPSEVFKLSHFIMPMKSDFFGNRLYMVDMLLKASGVDLVQFCHAFYLWTNSCYYGKWILCLHGEAERTLNCLAKMVTENCAAGLEMTDLVVQMDMIPSDVAYVHTTSWFVSLETANGWKHEDPENKIPWFWTTSNPKPELVYLGCGPDGEPMVDDVDFQEEIICFRFDQPAAIYPTDEDMAKAGRECYEYGKSIDMYY